MAEENKNEKLSWEIPEYIKHKRNKTWYIMASIIGLGLIVYSFFTNNFLFSFIIIIAGAVIIVTDSKEPQRITISLEEDGVKLGKKFYDYDEFKNFSIVYKPKNSVKNLYFEFNSAFKHRLSIPLEDQKPLQLRDFLLKYVEEDTDRTDEPLSESLSNWLKL